MRYQGFVSPNQAAERLRVNRKTVLDWCHRSLEDDDDPPIRGVERTRTGHMLIPVDEVNRLAPKRGR